MTDGDSAYTSLNTSFTPSNDVLVAHLAGEAVLLNLSDKNYYRLNETAAFIWAEIEKGADRSAIVASLVNAYEVDGGEAAKELDKILLELSTRQLIEIHM